MTTGNEIPGEIAPLAIVQKLFLKHSGSIRGYLFALTADGHLVDDVLHSTFLAVTDKADHYDPQREFVPWVRGFAKNELLKAVHQQQRGPLLLSSEAIERLHDAAPDFSAADERIAALLACLDQLGPRARQAVLLRYREELRPQDIAEQMRLAVASVNVTLSKARAALGRCVELKLRAAT